jgi:vitamin B12 transporter
MKVKILLVAVLLTFTVSSISAFTAADLQAAQSAAENSANPQDYIGPLNPQPIDQAVPNAGVVPQTQMIPQPLQMQQLQQLQQIPQSPASVNGATQQIKALQNAKAQAAAQAAKPAGTDLGEVVVTARQIPETLSLVPRQVNILKKTWLDNEGLYTLTDALDVVPGIDVKRYGDSENLSTISVRGADSRQTLILMNGIPAERDIVAGGTDLSLIDMSGAGKIEIIEDGMSSIYGADASAGVVNVITGGGDKYWVKGTGTFGTFDTQEQILSSNNKIFGTDYFISGMQKKSDGFLGQAYLKQAADAVVEFGKNSLDSKLMGTYLKRNLTLAPGSNQINEDYSMGADEMLDMNYVKWNFNGYLTSSDLTYADDYYPARHQKKEMQGRLTAIYGEGGYLSAMAGGVLNNKNIISTSMDTQNLSSRGMFSNVSLALLKETLLVNGGVRYDSGDEINGNVISKNISAKMMLPENVELSASVENSFSLPTAGEKYFREDVYSYFGTDYITDPNPDLRPELCDSYEASVVKKDKKIKETLSWFRRDSTDLIQNVSVLSGNTDTTKAENVNKARVMGLEASVEFSPLDYATLSSQYTYMEAIDVATNQPLTYKPQNKLNIQVLFTLPYSTDISAVYEYVDARNIGYGQYLPAYYLLDLHVTHTLDKNVKLFAEAKNILNNSTYEVSYGMPMPGRTIMAGAEISYQ